MNISPPHRPIPLHRPWWSRRRLPLVIGALLLGGSAVAALAGRDMGFTALAAVSATPDVAAQHGVPTCAAIAQALPAAQTSRGE